MKDILLTLLFGLGVLSMVGLPTVADYYVRTTEQTEEVVEPTKYMAHGYFDGQYNLFDEDVLEDFEEYFVYDVDGMLFDDTQESVGNYWYVLSDEGTPNDFTDDVIIKTWPDRYTDIYDEMYSKMSDNDNWIVSRDGNNITISLR